MFLQTSMTDFMVWNYKGEGYFEVINGSGWGEVTVKLKKKRGKITQSNFDQPFTVIVRYIK